MQQSTATPKNMWGGGCGRLLHDLNPASSVFTTYKFHILSTILINMKNTSINTKTAFSQLVYRGVRVRAHYNVSVRG